LGKLLKIKIRSSIKSEDVELQISNRKRGHELKEHYLEKIGNKNGKVRLFCMGQEIEDNEFLSNYNMENQYVLLALLL